MTINNDYSLKINHVGFAVKSIEQYLDSFAIPGFELKEVMEPIYDPIQQVKIVLIPFANGSSIELVEPAGTDSPAVRFAESRTGGIYHVCYETDDLESTTERLRSVGCVVVNGPAPAIAFGNSQIVFLMNRYGDLVELLETPVKN